MHTPRYLCSHLVRLHAPGGREQWVNLEEIWSDGAVFACEEEVVSDALVNFSTGDVSFEGRVTAVERDEFGWCIEMAFADNVQWTLEKFRPDHALNPDEPK
jgi:hypothetical protein